MTHAIATLYGFCCTFFNITFLSAENSHEDLQSQVCGVFQCILNIVEGMYFCVFVFFFVEGKCVRRELKTSMVKALLSPWGFI